MVHVVPVHSVGTQEDLDPFRGQIASRLERLFVNPKFLNVGVELMRYACITRLTITILAGISDT